MALASMIGLTYLDLRKGQSNDKGRLCTLRPWVHCKKLLLHME